MFPRSVKAQSQKSWKVFHLILSTSFWKIAGVDIRTYFIPANCRDHQISPVVELTHYPADSYYHDQTQTRCLKCSHSQDKMRKLLKSLQCFI